MKLVEFEVAGGSYTTKKIHINPEQVISVSELTEYGKDVVTLIEVSDNGYRVKESLDQVVRKLTSE